MRSHDAAVAFMLLAFAAAFEHVPSEMAQDGRAQYELMMERAELPRYGDCWRSAVQHVHEGCTHLSEDTQSDMTLHVTNCFLEMSGHETYNCASDKKPNLKRICIGTMSDRAFQAYTQFYTHMQNICWFIKGHVWQEKIFRGTLLMSERLSDSVVQQQELLRQQRDSISMQERLLDNGKVLERTLNESRIRAESAVQELRMSVLKHQKLLGVIGDGLTELQSWLIGEVSWLDSLAFYVVAGIAVMFTTSTARTSRARLPALVFLSVDIALERLLCAQLGTAGTDGPSLHDVQKDLYRYVWWCRHITLAICITLIFIFAFTYCDVAQTNHNLLLDIQRQGVLIRFALDKMDETKFTPVVSSHKYNLRKRADTPDTILKL